MARRSYKELVNDKAIAEGKRDELRAEGLELLGIAAEARTPQQVARLAAIDAEQADLAREIAQTSRELAPILADHDATIRESRGWQEAHGAPARPSGRTYAAMFGRAARGLDGWRSADEFLSVVQHGRSDDRLRWMTDSGLHAAARIGSGGDGGFSVPTELVAQWLDASLEGEIVRPRAQVWPMASETRKVPAWRHTDASGGALFGGFSGNWVAEATEITPHVPQMRLLSLTARKLALLTEVSNELAADGVSYEDQLSTAMIKSLGWFLDSACLRGTGAGQPLGVFHAPATIEVAPEGGQSADTIVYANLAKMFARLHPASIPNSVWVANPTTIPQLLALTITVGDGGSHIPVMTGTDGAFSILTRPVIFSEKASALGDRGDISLCDFSQYAIGIRKDMSLDKSAHVGFTRDTSHYRGLIRVDGQPTWEAPYTPAHGATLSPFVVLGAR